jgi:hypothetical protein
MLTLRRHRVFGEFVCRSFGGRMYREFRLRRVPAITGHVSVSEYVRGILVEPGPSGESARIAVCPPFVRDNARYFFVFFVLTAVEFTRD